MIRNALALLVLAGLMTTAGCSTRPPEDAAPNTPAAPSDTTEAPGQVAGAGTITFFDLEGGFYGLIADDGGRYDPLNLDAAFRQDGLRVRFRARLRTDVMTVRQWGKPVEILEMARLDP